MWIIFFTFALFINTTIFFFMSIFAILFYFGSGMFISFVLLLGLSLLYKVPGAVFEVQNDSSLRVVGVALLVLTLPVVFELFRDFFPTGSVFADYVIPSVDALAAAFLTLAVFSFLRHNRYAVLSFLAIGVSALVVFLFVAIFGQVQIFLVLVGIWLIALLAVSVVRAIRFRASIKCGNSFRVVVLLLFFLLNFVLNPFFLYVSITARDVQLFSVYFSLTWMSMGIVLLNVVISSFAASDDEGGEPLQAVGAADVPEVPLADDSDRRTADDYFSVDQQQKMKAQLEKIMVKDKCIVRPTCV